MSIVLKISKPTYDVLTTGDTNLTFSSELATHAIYNVYDITFPSGIFYTITHNLGYVPKVWVYLKYANYLKRIPIITGVADGLDYWITSTTVVIDRDNIYATGTYIVVIFTRSPNP